MLTIMFSYDEEQAASDIAERGGDDPLPTEAEMMERLLAFIDSQIDEDNDWFPGVGSLILQRG